jgi:hypothetical protein
MLLKKKHLNPPAQRVKYLRMVSVWNLLKNHLKNHQEEERENYEKNHQLTIQDDELPEP